VKWLAEEAHLTASDHCVTTIRTGSLSNVYPCSSIIFAGSVRAHKCQKPHGRSSELAYRLTID
jgi:hypothetical protein